MKVYCYLLVLIIQTVISYSTEYEFTPININFNGVVAKKDTIIAYGDFGSLLVSFDAAMTWKHASAFERGKIQKLFWTDDKIIAINDAGEVSISYDKAVNWHIIHRFADSVREIGRASCRERV